MRTLTTVVGTCLAIGLTAAIPAKAQQAAYLAANCANCHGTDGRSAGGAGMPGLAGLSTTYFTEQMKAFREGKRTATIMHQLAKGYSDEQIAAMADFFSRQKPSK
jgi:cytochrome c553